MIRISNKEFFVSLAELSGLIFIPIIIMLISGFGPSPFDVLFVLAEILFYVGKLLQQYNTLLFIFSILLSITIGIFVFRYLDHVNENQKILFVTRLIFGLLLSCSLIYYFLDALFYRSYFMIYPFLAGIIGILFVLIEMKIGVKNQVYNIKEKTINVSLVQILWIGKLSLVTIISIMLIFANIGFTGYKPTPPKIDNLKFGGTDRPYQVKTYTITFQPPNTLDEFIEPISTDHSLKVKIFIPTLRSGPIYPGDQVPISIFNHGIGAYEVDIYYSKIMQLMASRGSVAIFTQYPDDVLLKKGFTETDNDSIVYNPAHYLRYQTLYSGIIKTLDLLVNKTDKDLNSLISNHLGPERSINFDNMLIVGHSYGGGAIPFIAGELRKNGFALDYLIMDMEAPWVIGEWNSMHTAYSKLEENIFIHINTYQDDFRFDQCVPLKNFAVINSQSRLDERDISFSITLSDRYGFPRLVATHFVPADPLVDELTHYGVFKRIDAQIAYVIGLANNASDVKEEASLYFKGGGERMLDMGHWSDDTQVNRLIYSSNPLSNQESIAQSLNYYSSSYCEDAYED